MLYFIVIVCRWYCRLNYPLTLIPLLKFSSSSTKMGPHKYSIYVSHIIQYLQQPIFSFESFYYCQQLIGNNLNVGNYILQIIVVWWIVSLGNIGINVYYLCSGFVRWLIHNILPKVRNVLIGIIEFPLTLL